MGEKLPHLGELRPHRGVVPEVVLALRALGAREAASDTFTDNHASNQVS
jgi:hypothetical protein